MELLIVFCFWSGWCNYYSLFIPSTSLHRYDSFFWYPITFYIASSLPPKIDTYNIASSYLNQFGINKETWINNWCSSRVEFFVRFLFQWYFPFNRNIRNSILVDAFERSLVETLFFWIMNLISLLYCNLIGIVKNWLGLIARSRNLKFYPGVFILLPLTTIHLCNQKFFLTRSICHCRHPLEREHIASFQCTLRLILCLHPWSIQGSRRTGKIHGSSCFF